ncbi:hypothetical protein EV294_103335 [Paenibacillus sp. BK033]|uniref:hypothetical protein n=1 Tax=Paenibacillus sp. BK033 TaxID=2512133 RepID=UPI00104B1F34|nr:hypothetical protein [Paenibacillus sp. BK033]TCM97907.1 hypothetical protein EV294_103335 [Paenibacillus sp. BK033]
MKKIVLICFLLVTVMLLILQGNEFEAHTPAIQDTGILRTDNKLYAGDVGWVYMSWPIPSQYVSKPLIGSKDHVRIAKLLQWIAEAKQIDGKEMTSPLMERSMAVNIEFKNHDILQIRPAWHCTATKQGNGNTETSCTTVQNSIWISDPVKGEYFADSEKLFQFVSKDHSKWLPDVLPYEVPSELKLGSPFTVLGHGARADQVEISLLKGNQVIWKQNALVNEGEWQTVGELPGDLIEGEYDWKIGNGESSYGVGVHIKK